jgi:restriction endonuclease S subunit
LNILVPPIGEQKEIIKYLDEIISKTNILLKTIKQQIRKIREYHQSLIAAAVTGKMDIREELIVR